LMQFYGVTERGNFEERNVLHLAGGVSASEGVEAEEPVGLAEMRRALYEARAERARPGLDDKRLAAWNALTIAALAEAGAALEREDYLEAARACAEFIREKMRDADGRLLRSYKDGRAQLNAYLEDHAFLLEALLTLYEATFEPEWFAEAKALAETMLARFHDPERGGFFSTSGDHEALIARRSYEQAAEGVFRLFAEPAVRHPEAFAHLLRAIDFHLSPTKEVALVGEDLAKLAGVVRAEHRPHLVLAGGPEGSTTPELLRDRPAIEGKPTAYVCEGFACQQPVSDPASLSNLL
jgi:uncharacterized protein